MTPLTRKKLRISVLFKCVLILTVATAVVAGVIAVTSDRAIRQVASDGLRQLSVDATETLADSLSGALRFRKVADIELGLGQFLDDKQSQATAGIVIFSDGSEVLIGGGLATSEIAQLRTLAEAAVATGAPESTLDGFWRGQPIVASDAVIGAVAVAWSPDDQLAVIDADRRSQLILAGAVFLLLTSASGLFFRQSLAVPLMRIAKRTTGMADGDLSSDVPHLNRSDEIGQIANQLDFLRDKLRAAEDATRDAHFKSAGFQEASVPLVMTDADFRITHLNQAFGTLLEEPAIQERFSGLTSDNAVGQKLDPKVLDGKRFTDAVIARLPTTAEIPFGNTTFRVTLNDIKTAGGAGKGYVMEWNDVTKAHVTKAVLAALETAQIRVDFDANGLLSSINKTAQAVSPELRASLNSTHISEVVETLDERSLDSLLRAGEPHFDTFQFAKNRLVSGIVSPILGADKQLTGIVFLGHDITESEKAKKAAEDRRALLERNQQTVVEALNRGLSALAEGNLTIRLNEVFPEGHEELRAHFNGSIQSMEAAVAAVRDNSTSILHEADNIAGAADDLSRRTEQQAATLEQFAASLTELTASVAATADGAGQASEVVTTARTNAESSGTVVQEAVEAMGEISGSSERISRIISVIDDIAFQTNLLALNAGVEAARAGDAGRGFAVVASEVRALAQRSSEAAREINELISSSSAQVKRGVSLVGRAGEALENIVGSIGGIADHVTSIAASAREQSTGIDEINAAMSQLDQATQQNVAMFEETTAATHTLRSEASSLVSASERFTVSSAGANRPPALQGAVPEFTHRPTRPRNNQQKPSRTEGALALAEEDNDEWEDF